MIRLGICNELFEGWEFGQVCRTVKAWGTTVWRSPRSPWRRGSPTSARDASASCGRWPRTADLAMIGLHWLLAKTEGFYLTTPDAAVRRETGDYLVALAEATRDLGGELMVLGSPKQRDLLPGVTDDQAFDYAAEVFTRIMPEIGELGVDLCLEPLAPSETNFLNTCAQAEGADRPRRSSPTSSCTWTSRRRAASRRGPFPS